MDRVIYNYELSSIFKLYKNCSDRLQSDVIFTDVAKAFDKVDHSTLLAKLNILGVNSTILNWISYIFGTNTRNRARPRTFSKLWSA